MKTTKIFLSSIFSLGKAVANTFVYFVCLVLFVTLFVELYGINLVEYLKLAIYILLPIVFINDLVKNFKGLLNIQHTKVETDLNDKKLPIVETQQKIVATNPIMEQVKKKETRVIPTFNKEEYVDWTKNRPKF